MKISPVITALNTPGVFVEALTDLPISWPFRGIDRGYLSTCGADNITVFLVAILVLPWPRIRLFASQTEPELACGSARNPAFLLFRRIFLRFPF